MMSRFRFLPITLLALLLALPAMPACAQQQPYGGSDEGTGAGPNYESRLQNLEDQMRTLDGRIEELQYANKQLTQQVQRLQEDTETRLANLEAKMAAQAQTAAPAPQAAGNFTAAQPAQPPAASAPQESQEPQQPPPGTVKGTLGSLKTTENGHVVGGSVQPHAPPLPKVSPDYTLTPEEQYDRAFDLLRKADYADAEQAFKDFLAKNPSDRLVTNAKYWYAETLYVQNKYNAAAVAFADAYQANPHGDKAPDNLLDLAKTLAALGKQKDACVTLSSLKAKYPAASYRVRANAKETRAKLKCGAAE